MVRGKAGAVSVIHHVVKLPDQQRTRLSFGSEPTDGAEPLQLAPPARH